MPQDKIRVISAIPGATSLGPILAEFSQKGQGIVSSLSDQSLRAAASLLPEDCPSEVAPFGEVVGKFFSMCGGHPSSIARRGHMEAAIALACEEERGEGPFGEAARFPGTHRCIQRTLGELGSWGIGITELRSIASRSSPDLRAKLEVLADIGAHAEESLNHLGLRTNDDRIRECVGLRVESKARLPHLLNLSATEATPMDIAWIKWAAGAGAAVTVVVDGTPARRGLFAPSDRVAAALGVKPHVAGTQNPLAASLFSSEAIPLPLEEDRFRVSISSAADRLAEAEWALRSCLGDAEDGIPLDRISIYVRDLEGYAPMILFASNRLGVPVRMARRAPLLTNAFARTLLLAVEVCASSDVRALLPLLKSSYLAISYEGQAEIEGALKSAYALGSRQWPALEQWAAGKMDEYRWLGALLKWRIESRQDRATLVGWMERLRSLIEAMELGQASAHGPESVRSRDVRAQNSLQRALAHHASVRSVRDNRPLDLHEFVAACGSILEESDTSVPVGEIGVQVVNAGEQLGRVDSLYVLGMLEGVFPRRRREDPVLTDEERSEISSLHGGTPLLQSHDLARAERDEFYRVCASPEQKITLSYPQTDEDRDNIPAFYLREVERAMGDRMGSPIDHPRRELTPAACTIDADQRLQAALRAERENPLPNTLATEEAAAFLRVSEEGPFTPHELREVLECPFRYASARRLELRPHRERSRWSALRRLPELAQIAKAENADAARQALKAALEEEIARIYPDSSDYDLALLEAGAKRLIEEWVEREIAARALWPKERDTVNAPDRFGGQALKGELPLFGGKLRLEGRVSATARMGEYSVAMITERQRANENPETHELSDLDKLEMGLYLLALHGKGKAAAVESESLHGERTLYVLPRVPGMQLASRRQQGLRVVDLGEPRDFLETTKKQLKKALRLISKPEVEATPYDHCRWCDFGELCRRHIDYSEERDPFESIGRAPSDEAMSLE